MKIGYARVSTIDQHLDMQVQALESAGCEKIFMEKVSGTKEKRSELQKMIDMLRPGDTVVVYKLCRLGRSTTHLIKLVTDWKETGIKFQSISDGLTLDDSAFGKMLFTLFAAMVQLERDLTSERTKAGLAARRKLGRIGGRPKGLSKESRTKAAAAKTLYEKNTMSVRQIAEQLGVSLATLYKYLRYEGVKIGSDSQKTQKAVSA